MTAAGFPLPSAVGSCHNCPYSQLDFHIVQPTIFQMIGLPSLHTDYPQGSLLSGHSLSNGSLETEILTIEHDQYIIVSLYYTQQRDLMH